MEFVQENPRYQKRVFLVYGSPLRAKDLRNARLDQAMAVFFLPHKFSNDGSREDAATVLRVLSVSQQLKRGTHTQLFAMLVNSENRTLLEATGLRSENLVCADELRLGLMGLSCRCPGLSTLVSNLITSRSADIINDPAKVAYIKPWVREYIMGAAKEIYSCKLATHLHGLTFTQCTQRIHRQSDGQVLLIAIEDGNDILFNPGHSYRIYSQSRAFLIAESVAALHPFEAPEGGDLCPQYYCAVLR
ncbi:hypothetical protein PINS_up023706 [Pythium insidiosum]|nr:hypothetical protein PINS_up023706 [Pythium insidiosum]